jgi:hypothetical protein
MRRSLYMLAVFLLSVVPSEASEPVPNAGLLMIYPVKELPVWSASGDFDPKLLIKLLESAVANSETTNEDQVRITAGESTAAIKVMASIEMHQKVWDVLAGLRDNNTDERPDFKSLLRRQQADAFHQDKMQSRMYQMEREQFERRRRMSLRDQPVDIP